MPPSKYNLRRHRTNKTTWVEDKTLKAESSSSSSEDEDYQEPTESEEDVDESVDEEEEESEEDEETPQITLPKGAKVSVKLHIHAVTGGKNSKIIIKTKDSDTEDESEEEEEEEDEDADDEDDDEDMVEYLRNKYAPGMSSLRQRRARRQRKEKEDPPALELNDDEQEYYEDLPRAQRKALNEKMKRLSNLVDESEVPLKFRVLDLDIPDSTKASVIKKIDILDEMGLEGEGFKLRNWVESFLRIPFGKTVPLPVTIKDGPENCAAFLSKTTGLLDEAVYGMNPAKTQIMQILAQWIASPQSVGNVIALKGPMGVGKTSFAKNGVAKVLGRPFEFFSLGGSSDSANFVGHSYTYEGSTWGRIADSLMNARCMNPVLYFDEVDKISTTSHGEEIVSMLIHLTDRSQNSQFHDRYFSGVDFDLSQCLFVFSFNDETKINPILRDRMQVINCTGYSAEEKKSIVTQYVWPQMMERIQIPNLAIDESAIKYMISEFSSEEQGVRTLIRAVETLVTRINLVRIADEKTAKSYSFYQKMTFPMTIDEKTARHILQDTAVPQNESHRHMYL